MFKSFLLQFPSGKWLVRGNIAFSKALVAVTVSLIEYAYQLFNILKRAITAYSNHMNKEDFIMLDDQDQYFNFDHEYDTGFEVKMKKIIREEKKKKLPRKSKIFKNTFFEDADFEENPEEYFSKRKNRNR